MGDLKKGKYLSLKMAALKTHEDPLWSAAVVNEDVVDKKWVTVSVENHLQSDGLLSGSQFLNTDAKYIRFYSYS